MAEKHTHTPGPWVATSDPFHFDSKTDVADEHGGMVASMCGQNPARSVWEMEANARLVAQAPAMLEALRAFVSDADKNDDEYGYANDAPIIKQARAVIAAATGEAP